jgi:hypothetical protein
MLVTAQFIRTFIRGGAEPQICSRAVFWPPLERGDGLGRSPGACRIPTKGVPQIWLGERVLGGAEADGGWLSGMIIAGLRSGSLPGKGLVAFANVMRLRGYWGIERLGRGPDGLGEG